MLRVPEIETAQVVRTHLSRRSPVRTLARNDLTMTDILQQLSPAAIGESPDAHSDKSDLKQPAETQRHWSDRAWEELKLPGALHWRIARVDRAVQAMGALQQLLMRDNRGVIEVEGDPDSYQHSALSSGEVQGIHLAFDLIWCSTYDDISDLRDNKHDCWRKGGRA